MLLSLGSDPIALNGEYVRQSKSDAHILPYEKYVLEHEQLLCEQVHRILGPR